MTKWEYKVVEDGNGNRLQKSLNGYGVEGWDIVSMFTRYKGMLLVAILKRQIVE
jgi:hypothetical protein